MTRRHTSTSAPAGARKILSVYLGDALESFEKMLGAMGVPALNEIPTNP
jgi:hypothetical protein